LTGDTALLISGGFMINVDNSPHDSYEQASVEKLKSEFMQAKPRPFRFIFEMIGLVILFGILMSTQVIPESYHLEAVLLMLVVLEVHALTERESRKLHKRMDLLFKIVERQSR